jgi:DNA-binding IclR family transcriptional regulator
LKEVLGINKSAVQRLLGTLKEKAYIEPAGEGGGWRVFITSSV